MTLLEECQGLFRTLLTTMVRMFDIARFVRAEVL